MKRKGSAFLFIIFLFALNCASFAGTKRADVNLLESSAEAGISVYWDPFSLSGVMEKNGRQISFKAGGDFALKNYSTIMNERAPYLKDGVLFAEEKFMSAAINFFKEQDSLNQYKVGVILIDPGHGGKDPGASATHNVKGKKIKVVEKDVNLNIGLKLYNCLTKAYPDKRIIMTRNKDVYLSLGQRTEIANSVKLAPNEAIVYVSIHVNASLDKSASGYEVWYLSPGYRRKVLNKDVSEDRDVNTILNSILEEEYTTESVLISKFIMEGIKAQVGKLSPSRGIKAEEWFVVRNANMPSVLVETGFLTNPTEGALLADEDYLQKVAFGIYNGLQAFVTHFESSRGFTVKNEK